MLVLGYIRWSSTCKIALDQSVTFHEVYPEQYQSVRLSTPMGIDKNESLFHCFGSLDMSSTVTLYIRTDRSEQTVLTQIIYYRTRWSTLFATRPAVLDTAAGNKLGLFKFRTSMVKD